MDFFEASSDDCTDYASLRISPSPATARRWLPLFGPPRTSRAIPTEPRLALFPEWSGSGAADQRARRRRPAARRRRRHAGVCLRRALQGRMSLFLKDDRGERPVGDVAGTIEDMRWAPDGGSLIVMAADRGLDDAATNGAQRLTGESRRSRGDKPGECAAPPVPRRIATDRRSRSGPPGSASGNSNSSAMPPRLRSSPPTPASAAGIMPNWPGSILRRVQRRPSTGRAGSSWRPRPTRAPSASPSSMAGPATVASSPATSASSTSPRARSLPSPRVACRASRRWSGATTTASGSPAGRASAPSTASRGSTAASSG